MDKKSKCERISKKILTRELLLFKSKKLRARLGSKFRSFRELNVLIS